MTKCLCDCGKEVKNKFINGHQQKGKKFSEEHKQKIRESNIGKKRSDETREKVRLSRLGKKLSDETKNKISAVHIGKKHSKMSKMKMSIAQTGKKALNETRLKISKSRKSYLEKHPEVIEEFKRRDKNPTKRIETMRRNGSFTRSIETRQKISKASKEHWKSDDYAWKVMHRREKSDPEKDFEMLVKENNLNYEFVGNGAFRIGRKNPDFVHHVQKKVVEIFGEFFHKGEDPKNRIDYFAERGYKCLVIWAGELKRDQENLLRKIREFNLSLELGVL